MDATAWIELVLLRAKDLRGAGVLAIGCDGCTATLEALPPRLPEGDVESDEPAEPINHWHDPATYPDGIVPGFEIHKLER